MSHVRDSVVRGRGLCDNASIILCAMEEAMAVDIVMRAIQRREQIMAELARLDTFLAMAAELARDGTDLALADNPNRARRQTARRGSGVGIKTVAAALEIVQENGPQPTRDLVPLIEARGIEVGGKSKIATLSARLSTTGKGMIRMFEGKWHEAKQHVTPGPETAFEREELADAPVKDEFADLLFHQTKEGRYAAALA